MRALVLSSGGVDSTTCLGMAVDKYGKENVVSLSLFQLFTDRNIQKNLKLQQKWPNITELNIWQ